MTASARHLLAFLLTLLSSPALFAGGVVNNCTEADLRAAMAGGGTVTFACDGTIVLESVLLINRPTVVDGAGHDVTIMGNGAVRIFDVTTNTLELRGLTIALGRAVGTGPSGGGLRAMGATIILERCTFKNNFAQSGGAIALLGHKSGSHILQATGCTFADNQSSGGGAVHASSLAALGFTNCTFYGNTVTNSGKGSAVYCVGYGYAEFLNCTFTRNEALGGSAAAALAGYIVKLNNCILAGNPGVNLSAVQLEGVRNMLDDFSPPFPNSDNFRGVDPLLEGPGLFGGTTLAFALNIHSPARDAAAAELSPAFDQRWFPRPRALGFDIGALEMQPPPGPPFIQTGVVDLTLSLMGTTVLEALVDPSGLATTVQFEYGTTSSLGTTSGVVLVANNDLAAPVRVSVSGLQPGHQYFYRAIATNINGRTEGQIRSFSLVNTVVECTEFALRQAMAFSNVVNFQCAGTITLGETLVVDRNTTLDATGTGTSISGQGVRRLFVVQPGVMLTLRGLNLVDGHSLGMEGGPGAPTPPGQPGMGGCILNQGGNVILEDCLLSGHVAEGGRGGESGSDPARGGEAYGGAICNLGGHVTIHNCIVKSNVAVGGLGSPDRGCEHNNGPSGDGLGGAIYTDNGAIEITATMFIENIATGGTPVYGCLNSYSAGGNATGGAINATNSTLLIQGSTFATNMATTAGSPWSGSGTGSAQGGALFVDLSVDATIMETTFLANHCQSGGTPRYAPVGKANGGAILNRANLRLFDSILSLNRTLPGPGNIGVEGDGGAIASTGTLIITGSTFDHNTAMGSSGVGVSGYSRHGFDGAGGAVWSGGLLNVTNSTFAANIAQGGNSDAEFDREEPGGAGLGGALQIGGGTAVLVNLTIANNQAIGGGSDSPHVPPSGATLGGGLGVSTNSSVTILNTILSNNSPGSNTFGSVIDGGYNISSDDTPLLTAPRSRNNTDPLLDVLADNGGPTPTMALFDASPALDAIPLRAPPVDQRGESRPQGPGADIGAYEASRLTIRISMKGGNVFIAVEAEAGGTYRLLRSTHFTQWDPIDSQTAENSQPIYFIQPISSNTCYSYRVVAE